MLVVRWRSRVYTCIPLLRVLGAGGVCVLVSKSYSTFCYLKDWRSRGYSRIPLPSVLGMGGCGCGCLLVTKSYSTLHYSKDCSPTKLLCAWNSAGILEWVAIPFYRGSSSPRDWTLVSCTAGRFFSAFWATGEALSYLFITSQLPSQWCISSENLWFDY